VTKTIDRVVPQLASILSIVLALWGLAFVANAIGAIGGAGAALFGLVFGILALLSDVRGRWRKTALAGIAVSVLALVVFGFSSPFSSHAQGRRPESDERCRLLELLLSATV
jgi:hypothetical protein